MSSSSPTQLLDLILEKERQERQHRNGLILCLLGNSAGMLGLLMCGILHWNASMSVGPQQDNTGYNDAGKVGILSYSTLDPSTVPGSAVGNIPQSKKGDLDSVIHMVRPQHDPSLAFWQGSSNHQDDTSGTGGASIISADEMEEIHRRIRREGPFSEVDVLPAFPGGEASLKKFLSKQLKYPAAASRSHVQGTVYVRFVIDLRGQVTAPTIMKGIGKECDEEALRVVSLMPAWVPAKVSGINVPAYSTIAIHFRFI